MNIFNHKQYENPQSYFLGSIFVCFVCFASQSLFASMTMSQLQNSGLEWDMQSLVLASANIGGELNQLQVTSIVEDQSKKAWSLASLASMQEMTIEDLIEPKASQSAIHADDSVLPLMAFQDPFDKGTEDIQADIYNASTSISSAPAFFPAISDFSKTDSQVDIPSLLSETGKFISVKFVLQDLVIEPQEIAVSQEDPKMVKVVGDFSGDQLRIFVRNPDVAQYDPKSKELTILKAGNTEVYFVSSKEMKIVSLSSSTETEVAETKDVNNGSTIHRASMVDIDAPIEDPASQSHQIFDEEDSESETYQDSEVAVKVTPAVSSGMSVSVEQSKIDAARTLSEDVSQSRRFQRLKQNLEQSKLSLQIIDDRSVPEQGLIYPAVGVAVKLIGSDVSSKTDAKGIVSFLGLPLDSHFLVSVEDNAGVYRASVFEVGADDVASGLVKRLQLSRYAQMDFFAEVSRSVQRSDTSSLCLKIIDSSDEKTQVVEGYAIQIDIAAEGPFFFKEGRVDAALKTAGADGRTCYFNLDPGPYLVRITKQGEELVAAPLVSYAGKHLNHTWDLAERHKFSALSSATETATSHLGTHQPSDLLLRPMNDVDIVSLGSEHALEKKRGEAAIGSDWEVTPDGRLFVATQMEEFETTVQAISSKRFAKEGGSTPSNNQIILLPRGFMEDMAEAAAVTMDSQLGSIYVEYGHHADFSEESVDIRILNENGQEVGKAFYFSDFPTSRAVFFDLNPGKYFVSVESKSGRWLAADTVTIYSESTSVLALGAPILWH